MVRRAGLIDGPAERTLSGPSLATGSRSGMSDFYRSLAKTADDFRQEIQPIVDAQTEEAAQQAVAEGRFDRTRGITRQDRLYNKVIDTGALAQGALDIDRTVTDLESQSLETLDIDEFKRLSEEARIQYIEDSPAHHKAALIEEWNKRSLAAEQRLSKLATDKALTRSENALKARREYLENRHSGTTDPNDPEFQNDMSELYEILMAEVQNPLSDMTPEEAVLIYDGTLSKVQANRFGEEAYAMYVDNGSTDEAYSAADEYLREMMDSPELNLSRTERSAIESISRSRLNAARSEARATQREFEARIKDAEREFSTMFSVDYAEANLRASEGFGPSDAEIRELAKLAVNSSTPERNMAKVERLAMTSAQQQAMRSLSIPEQEAHVSNLESTAAAGNPEAALMLDSARTVASASRRAAEANPAGFAAMQEGRELPTVDWSERGRSVETMADYFIQGEEAGRAYGVPPKYFSPSSRKQLANIMTQEGPARVEVVGAIFEAAQEAGIDPLKPFGEIANDTNTALLGVAGGMQAMGVPSEMSGMVLSGQEALKTDVVKKAMPSQSIQARVQEEVIGPEVMSRMRTEHLDSLTRAADSFYAANFLATGEEGPRAYEKALQAVMGEWRDDTDRKWGGVARFNSQSNARAPSWMAASNFGAIFNSLDETALLSMGGPGFIGSRQASMADYRQGRLIDAGPGRYHLAPDPKKPNRVVTNAAGEPLLLDLNNVRDALRTRYPHDVR